MRILVQACRRRSGKVWSGQFVITKMNFAHKNCVSLPKPTMRQIAASATFASAVRAAPEMSAKSIIDHMRTKEGIGLNMHKRSVYRAREVINNVNEAVVKNGIEKLPSFLNAFARLNPGVGTRREKSDAPQFMRAIVIMMPFVDAIQARQPILGIDCSHSKCPFYSGVQMHLLARDGNLRNMYLAFALVPAEDKDNYHWFLSHVIQGGCDVTEVPIFCDRDTALLSVGSDMNLNLKYCTLRILRNVAHRFGALLKTRRNMVWSLQKSETEEEYEIGQAMIAIDMGADVMNYLKEIDPVNWCVYANLKCAPLFGWRTSNFVESEFGSQVAGIRSLHPLEFFERMYSKMVDDCYKRSSNAVEWERDGLRVTPGATTIFEKQIQNLGQYEVQRVSPDISYVLYKGNIVDRKRRVNLAYQECTCFYMNQYQIPCRHFMAMLADLKKQANAFDAFAPWYTADSYVNAFKGKFIMVPLDEEIRCDTSWLMPAVTKKKGRRKTKRIRSDGEGGCDSRAQSYQCSRCGGEGHNKRSCTRI